MRAEIYHAYPMCMDIALAKQYSDRRGITGCAPVVQPAFSESERHALGNWKQKSMPSHYSHTKMLESFVVKYTCIKALNKTAEVRSSEGLDPWKFVWGELPERVPDVTDIKREAYSLGKDITSEEASLFSRTGRSLDLPAQFGAKRQKTETGTRKGMEDTTVSSESSSSSSHSDESPTVLDSEHKSNQDESEISPYLLTWMLSGGKGTKIHTLDESKSDETHWWATCNRRILKSSGICKQAYSFNAWDRTPCPSCSESWPEQLSQYLL